MGVSIVVSLSVLFGVATAQQELLQNPGLESLDGWHCWGIQCDVVNDHHGGNHAISATQRKMYYQGPGQTLRVVGGHVYRLQAWIKMLNDNGNSQHIELMVSHKLTSGTINYDTISAQVPVSPKSGWVLLSGEVAVPPTVKESGMYFQGPDPGIGFLVDDASMKEIHTNDANWKAEANARIETVRKNDIHVKVTADSGIDHNSISIEITQKRSLFAFGTKVVASLMNNNNSGVDAKYRQFIFDHYNWVTIGNALKWGDIEPQRGQVDFTKGTTSVNRVRSHGIKVRGHNLIWSASEEFAPWWLRSLPPDVVKSEVNRHIQQTVTHYKGLVEHWDVNNEMLHGQYYENKFHDPDYTEKIFRLVHQYDPTVKLFLNEYGVVSTSEYTEAYLAQAKKYKASNTFVGGMGVQCHFSPNPVPSLIKQRLDRLAEAGLPIWATEVDVTSDDENQRADWYEVIYRTLFSHPAVEGIISWGFWDKQHWRGTAASLVSGDEFRITAAGQRVLHMMETEWRTNDSRHLSNGTSYTVRGFHGDYDVKVKVNGNTVQSTQFTLGKSDHTLNLHVTA